MADTVSCPNHLYPYRYNLLLSFLILRSDLRDILGTPEVAAQFSKNLKNLPVKHPLKAKKLTVDTLGMTNGCIDFEYSLEGFPQYAYNNTYGVRFINETVYNQAIDSITMPGGVIDSTKQCRALGLEGDPAFLGNNCTVNDACMNAFYKGVAILGGFAAIKEASPVPPLKLPSDRTKRQTES